MAEKFKYSDEQLSTLLDGIYSGKITEYDIPQDLYFAIADYLKSGVYHGFGGSLSEFSGKDFELLNELRENIYMFSAAKSYQQIKDIGSLMLDENGDRVSNSEFNRLGAERFDTWNSAYGRSEYNTAVAQATMAGKWNEIQENKDLLPILTYSTIGDACDICAPLDGLTAPVDDPVWNEVMPTNHFNCECTVSQHEEGTELTPDDEKEQIFDQVTKEMDDCFRMNPGKDGYIFSPDHPYFHVEPKDREFAKSNFGLPIPSVAEETGGKVQEFIGAKTINEAKDRIKNVIVDAAGLNIDRVSISSDLTLPSVNRRLETIENLFTEYRINPLIDKSEAASVTLKSTKKYNGFIKYEYNSKQNKAFISNINFGDHYLKERTLLNDPFRKFCKVDEANQEISTTVHEFGHIMSIDLSRYIKNQPEWFRDFNHELRQIRDNYRSE